MIRGLYLQDRQTSQFEIVIDWPIVSAAPTVQDVVAMMNEEGYAAAVEGALAGRLHHAAVVEPTPSFSETDAPIPNVPTQSRRAGVKGTVTVTVAAPDASDNMAMLREVPEAIGQATRRFLTDTLPLEYEVTVHPLVAAMKPTLTPARRAVGDWLRHTSSGAAAHHPPAGRASQVVAPAGGGPGAVNRVLSDRYGMRLTVGQLSRIALSDRNNGEDVLDLYYGWRNDRAMSIAKGMGAALASMLAAWLIPLLKNEYEGTPGWLVFGPPLTVLLASSVWAVWSFWRLDRIHQSYVTSVALLQDLRP